MRRPIYHLSLALILALLCLAPHSAMATNRTVTNLNDSGLGSLRQTIIDSVSGDTIGFAVTGTLTLTSGELAIGRSITITGPAGGLAISGNSTSRVFNVSNGTTSGPTVVLAGLTITKGLVATDNGGAIFNDHSTLTVNNCTISSNVSNSGAAGGIRNESGTVTVTNCTFSGNTSGGFGGGVSNFGSANLTNCTLSGNSGAAGGGLANVGGTVTVTNCTLSGNSAAAGGAGGGIDNASGTVTMTNCTLSGNSATDGGGLANFNSGTSAILLNTIIARNTTTDLGPDVFTGSNAVTSQGHNLIGNTSGSSGWIASDQLGTFMTPLDPLLEPLQDNGGPTQTMALQSTSGAIDGGDDAVLGAPLNLTTDQRGPGFPRRIGSHVDIGAFEFDNVPQSGPTFTVTNNFDHDDGICGAVDCTLREAINAANAASGPNTITFAPGVTGTITLSGVLGALNIADSTTIIGPGARLLAVSGNRATTLFDVGAGTNTISGLTIRDGMLTGSAAVFTVGGGIFNSATLTLSDCALSGNQALGGDSTSAGGSGGDAAGGAIGNTGMLTLNRCTFSGNAATGGLGGNNSASFSNGGHGGAGEGGAVFNNASAALAINNCTFNGNSATGKAGGNGTHFGGSGGNGSGGAVLNLGMMTVTAATLNGNTGSGGAGGTGSSRFNNGSPGVGSGGLAAGGGSSAVGDTISAGNTGNNGGGADADGTFSSNGYNFIGTGGPSTGFTNGTNHDQVGTDAMRINPNLGPLQNNGGPTDTMALLSNNPPTPINTGDPNAPPQDQRYYLRSGVPDIGAFEFGGTLAPISAVSRKAHGSAGVFDINLPLTGSRGVECRTGGVTQVVFTFPTAVTINTSAGTQGASVTSGTGSVTNTSGSSTSGAPVVTVNLSGVTNAQYITVTLFGVNDGGTTTNDVSVQMGVLIGDTTADGSVNSADISQTKSQSGHVVTGSNFREDVTVDGSINSADISLVKSKSGTALP